MAIIFDFVISISLVLSVSAEIFILYGIVLEIWKRSDFEPSPPRTILPLCVVFPVIQADSEADYINHRVAEIDSREIQWSDFIKTLKTFILELLSSVLL